MEVTNVYLHKSHDAQRASAAPEHCSLHKSDFMHIKKHVFKVLIFMESRSPFIKFYMRLHFTFSSQSACRYFKTPCIKYKIKDGSTMTSNETFRSENPLTDVAGKCHCPGLPSSLIPMCIKGQCSSDCTKYNISNRNNNNNNNNRE